jgi:ribose transport system permease protein/putative xylitol transport system permease protein
MFNLTTVMINFSILFLASLGGTFVIMVGCLDLSYSGVLTLSAIVTAILLPMIGLWSVPVGIGLGCTFGLANGLLFVKAKIPSFLVTLGTLYVCTGLSNLATPGGLSIPLSGQLDFLLSEVVPGVHTLLIWALGLSALSYFLARSTAYGWRIYSTGSSELGSILNGVNVERIRIATFALSGALAGTAGILLLSYFGAATSSLGVNLVFIPLAVIVVGGTALSGGVGGPHRTIIGAFLIAVILDGLTLSGASPGVVTLFQGVAIILTTTIVSREIKSMAM